MPTYSFPQFDVEIVNPTLEIMPDVARYHYIDKIADIDIVLTDSSGSSFGVRLFDINIPTLNAGTISAKVQLKLTEFEI